VGANDYPGRGYATLGETPKLPVSESPCHMNQIATINNEGAVHFLTYKATMTAVLFVDFLARLVRGADRKIFLIVDRLPAHESKAVETWLHGREDQIEVFYLPRGAPELNPVEYLNNEENCAVNAAKLPENERELRSNMQRFLDRLAPLPVHILRFITTPVSSTYLSYGEKLSCRINTYSFFR
jgi:DDE superfamily endonuclease